MCNVDIVLCASSGFYHLAGKVSNSVVSIVNSLIYFICHYFLGLWGLLERVVGRFSWNLGRGRQRKNVQSVTFWELYTVFIKNWYIWFLVKTSANVDQFSKILTDRFPWRLPPHLNYFATLPCQIWKFKDDPFISSSFLSRILISCTKNSAIVLY